jgi:hypothetical protein
MDNRCVDPLLGFTGVFTSSFAACIAGLSSEPCGALLATAGALGCGVFFVRSLDYQLLP